ncbi:hypothetical protein J4E91_000418 [Alternaria rosae]|nr:hypothetical protein J4E91_000418 [Alternaria rosae]
MTLVSDDRSVSVIQQFSPKLPDEIVLRIMKYHCNNQIEGVLLVHYQGSFEFPGIPRFYIIQHSLVSWREDEERESYTDPYSSIGSGCIQQILQIRLVSKVFARCTLDAFFTSPIVFQHSVSDLHGIKPTWFLPCQIEPQLVRRRIPIKARYYKLPRDATSSVDIETDIQCEKTGMDLALSKQIHLPTIHELDARLFAHEPARVFIHKHDGLVIRGIQFTGCFERTSFYPRVWSEKIIQMFFILLQHPDWRSADVPPGSEFVLNLR